MKMYVLFLSFIFATSHAISAEFQCEFKSKEIKSFFDASKLKYRSNAGSYYFSIDVKDCFTSSRSIWSCDYRPAGVIINTSIDQDNSFILNLMTNETLNDPVTCELD